MLFFASAGNGESGLLSYLVDGVCCCRNLFGSKGLPHFHSFLFEGLSGGLVLLIAFLENLTIPVLRSNIPNSAVQTIFVVIAHELGNLVLGFLL